MTNVAVRTVGELRRRLLALLARYSKKVKESTLVLLVPEADDHLGNLRRELDPSAMAAHITLLYPFVPAHLVDDKIIEQVRHVVSEITTFDYDLDHIGWFDQRVLYLGPTPQSPFAALTAELVKQFPMYQPYGGAFSDVVPHLTIAERGSTAQLKKSERLLEGVIPIAATAREVCLLVQDSSGHWQVRETFRLGVKG